VSTCVVTGCNRGIGLALSQYLLDRGDTVFGSTRNAPAPIAHDRFHPLDFDVRDQAGVDRAAASMDQPVDILINNAGIGGERGGPMCDADQNDFAQVLDVNVLGPLRVTRAFLPLLRRASGPKVMTISSQLGSMTVPCERYPAYGVSKAAVNKLMVGIAADLRQDGIAVVIAHPGWVRTDMGGSAAPLAPGESAEGLIGLLDQLTVETTGRFMNWNGTPHEW